jgi:simple sugar transport system substrate-binding protein
VPDIFKAMIAGEANASVELTPIWRAPAFDALLAYERWRPAPKHIKTESILFEPGSAEAQLELKKTWDINAARPLSLAVE